MGAKRKDGSFAKCGRSKQKGREEEVSKCVPLAKARRMSEGQRKSAVARKRAAANVGPKPTNVATFAKRKKRLLVDTLVQVSRANMVEVNLSNSSSKKTHTVMLNIYNIVRNDFQVRKNFLKALCLQEIKKTSGLLNLEQA